MRLPVLVSLAVGYIPIVLGLSIASIWHTLPVLLTLIAVFFGGAVLTLIVAWLIAAPDLSNRKAARLDAAADDLPAHTQSSDRAVRLSGMERAGLAQPQ